MSKWRPYIQRAGELATHQPVVAYYCRLHAIELMMKARKGGDTSPELEKQLLGELQEAENAKKNVNLSNNNGQSTTESFALSVFDGADAADHAARDNTSQAAVVQHFYAAALFLDICAQFYGELPPDLAEKARYARFRVVQIREGLRQGVPSYPVAPEPPAAAEPSVGAAPSASSGYTAPLAASSSHTPGGREEALKKTEMASSALDFCDVATARKCLQEALHALG